MRLVAENGEGMRLCDLARACGLNRNTVFNLADSLVREKLLEKTSDGKYLIGEFVRNFSINRKIDTYIDKVKEKLRSIHLEYPSSSIYYSELGNADIFVKMYFSPTDPGKALCPSGMTLNPYLTVAGLAFFAFAPDECLAGLKQKNPFEYHGLNAWGSKKKFERQVETARRKAYSETPPLTQSACLKAGLPVRDAGGSMKGALTFDLKNCSKLDTKRVLPEVIENISKIN
jgi:DNA-binding IclR family transcriptional regulator